MKKSFLTVWLVSFLGGCVYSYHDHAYEDVYYDDYYTDAYDPYYDDGYYADGGGVYYNDYNYYPDRWGLSYSDVYYTPYRYPRIGFYYSSAHCPSYYWGRSWLGCNDYFAWSGLSVGLWYSSWYHPHYSLRYGYYDYYGYYGAHYWYNHWRHRTYEHRTARSELARLRALRERNTYKYNTARYDRPSSGHYGSVNRDWSRPSTAPRGRYPSGHSDSGRSRSTGQGTRAVRREMDRQRSQPRPSSGTRSRRDGLVVEDIGGQQPKPFGHYRSPDVSMYTPQRQRGSAETVRSMERRSLNPSAEVVQDVPRGGAYTVRRPQTSTQGSDVSPRTLQPSRVQNTRPPASSSERSSSASASTGSSGSADKPSRSSGEGSRSRSVSRTPSRTQRSERSGGRKRDK